MNLSRVTTHAARMHGSRIAVMDGPRQWTYEAFDLLVDHLASGLALLVDSHSKLTHSGR